MPESATTRAPRVFLETFGCQLNFLDSDPGLSVFYIVAGVAVLAVSLVTNYQYSDKRDWTPQATVA